VIQAAVRTYTACCSCSLNDSPPDGPDRRTPMRPNIRLVVVRSKTLSHAFTIHGPRDTLPEGGLSHSRGTDEAQDRAFSLRHEFTNREKFNNALFHFFETVVVGVENFTRFRKIDLFLGDNAPRQLHQPIEVCSH